jgi:putative acetyltransferase
MIVTRPLRTDDLDAALAVERAAFGRAGEADLVQRLRVDGDATLEWVTEAQGRVIAHVLYSPVRIARGDDGRVLGLAPVGVMPAYQKQGIGDALIRQSLDALRENGHVRAVVVLGEAAYYTRFGFAPASHHGLQDVYGGGDAFMALALRAGGLDGYGGRVDYAPAFDLLSE